MAEEGRGIVQGEASNMHQDLADVANQTYPWGLAPWDCQHLVCLIHELFLILVLE